MTVHNARSGNEQRQGGVSYQNCNRCGGRHLASVCRHKETVCNACGKKGHIARAFRSWRRVQPNQPQPNNNTMTEDTEEDVYTMFPLLSKKHVHHGEGESNPISNGDRHETSEFSKWGQQRSNTGEVREQSPPRDGEGVCVYTDLALNRCIPV